MNEYNNSLLHHGGSAQKVSRVYVQCVRIPGNVRVKRSLQLRSKVFNSFIIQNYSEEFIWLIMLDYLNLQEKII